MNQTEQQSMARMVLALRVMGHAGREIQREIYSHPEIYGEKLTRSIRSKIAQKLRVEKQRLINEFLADLTTSED